VHPTQPVEIFGIMFLRHLVPWPSVNIHGKFYTEIAVKRSRSPSHLLMSFLLIYVALLRFFEEQQPYCVESAFIIRSMTINFVKTCKQLGTRKLPEAIQLNATLFVVGYIPEQLNPSPSYSPMQVQL